MEGNNSRDLVCYAVNVRIDLHDKFQNKHKRKVNICSLLSISVIVMKLSIVPYFPTIQVLPYLTVTFLILSFFKQDSIFYDLNLKTHKESARNTINLTFSVQTEEKK